MVLKIPIYCEVDCIDPKEVDLNLLKVHLINVIMAKIHISSFKREEDGKIVKEKLIDVPEGFKGQIRSVHFVSQEQVLKNLK